MPPSPTLRPLEVLVVDDEPAILDISKEFLETFHGMRVTVVDESPKALEVLASGEFNAVVSDYQMPAMDGLRLLKEVRSLGIDVPFILFTGRGREEVAIEALNNGADFYVQKGGDARSQYSDLAHKVMKAVNEREKEKRLRVERQRLERLLELYKMGSRPEVDVLQYALESALELCDASFGFLGLLDRKRGRMSLLCTLAGTSADRASPVMDVGIDEGPWLEAVRKREPVIDNDISDRSALPSHCPHVGAVRNLMMVPLVDGEDVVMISGLVNGPAGFDDSDAQQMALLLNGTWEIVKRRRSEESLVRSRMELEVHQDRLLQVESKFQTLFERSQDGIALMGEKFRETNSRWREMMGYSQAEMVGMAPWELSPERQPNGRSSEEMGRELIAKAMKDIMAHFEWTHRTKDGRLLECDVILQKVSSEGEDLLLASIHDISQERKDARVRDFMYRTSEAVQSHGDRRELFANIYDSLSRLLSIDSYYVSLKQGDETTFPFFVDHGIRKDVRPRRCACGLTEYVMDVGRPVLLDRRELDTLISSGRIEQMGERPEEYMGVPLMARGRTAGMMAVQNYNGLRRFRQEDLDLLTFLSEQVSLALERIVAREEMMSTNSLLGGTVDSTPIGILVVDEGDRILLANRPLREMLTVHDMALEGMDGKERLDMLTRMAADDGWKELLRAHIEKDPGTVTATLTSTDGRAFELSRSPYLVEERARGSIITVKEVTEVRRIQKGLQESEARLRAIFAAAPVGICVVRDRRFVRFNGRLLKLLGYSKEELMGQCTLMLYEGQEEFERVGREVYGPSVDKGVSWAKTRWRRKDGCFIDLLMSVSSFIAGEPEKGYVVTLTDLSEIEEARRLLQDRLEFEATLVTVSRMFSEMDSGNHYLVLERALGVIGAQQGADRAYLFDIDEDRNTCSNTVEWVARGVSNYRSQLQDVSLDEIPWWMGMLREHGAISVSDVSKMPAEAGRERDILQRQGIKSVAVTALYVDREMVGFLGFDFSKQDFQPTEREFELLRFIGEMFSNALSRWTKDNEVRLEQEKLVNVLNGAPMGALVFEKAGGLLSMTYFNEEGRVMLGEHAVDFLGRFPDEVLPFLGEEEIERLLLNAKEGEWAPGEREFYDHRSGEMYQMWASMLDQDHLAIFLLNVTDIQELNQRLLLANNKLTLLTKLATHDVRNKAMIVNANLDLLCMRLEEEGLKRYAENANKGVRDLLEITDRLHNYLSIGTGSLGWTDLSRAVEAAKGHLDQTDRRTPAVEVDAGVGGYQVQADHLLPMVLYNLLSNSIRHGGGVGLIRLYMEERDRELWLHFEDDGTGVPEDLRECLFDFSLDGRRQGHGLNFIKETLDMYGMHIVYDGSYREGARFVIKVPEGQYRRRPGA